MTTPTKADWQALAVAINSANAQLATAYAAWASATSQAMTKVNALIAAYDPPVVVPPPAPPPPAPTPTPPVPPVTNTLPQIMMPGLVNVDPLAGSAVVRVSLTQTPQSPVNFHVLTRNATAKQDMNFRRVDKTLVFQTGGPAFQDVTIPLMPPAQAGLTFDLYVTDQVNPGAAPGGNLTTHVTFTENAPIQPPATIPPAPPPPAPGGGMKGALTWQFTPQTFKASDAGGPDTFMTRFAFGRDQAGNGELGLYTDPQVFPGTNPYEIRNGILVLRAEKFNTPKSYNDKQFNYGACVLEANFISQLYGYFECEAQSCSARGTWPAFWMLPSDGSWPPEIDVFEHPRNGSILPSFTTVTNHWNDANGQHQMVGTGNLDLRPQLGQGIDLTTGFHTYGVDWRADWTSFYIDGVLIFRTNTTFKKPAYPLWDVAVGGWGGSPDFSTGTTELLIRAARVYK